MKFVESEAYHCRYSECAEPIVGDWDIIWDESEPDYQGMANFIAKNPLAEEYIHLEWTYGSCMGCDDWESRELSNDQITHEMNLSCVRFSNKETFARYCSALKIEL